MSTPSVNSPIKIQFQHKIIPLVCISCAELLKFCFLISLRDLGENADLYISILLFISVATSAIIGHFSDKYCRKKTLVYTLLFSTFSTIFLFLNRSFFALVFSGLGAAGLTPVARAAYIDVNIYRKKDKVLTETLIAQAFTWAILCWQSFFLIKKTLLITALIVFLIVIVITILNYKDFRDNEQKKHIHSIKTSKKHFLIGYPLRIMIAFLIYDYAYQLINYWFESYSDISSLKNEFYLVQGSGILTGCLFIRFALSFYNNFKSSYKTILLSSIILISTFLFPFLFHITMHNFLSSLDAIVLLSFSTIGGVVLALIFSYFAHLAEPHESGFLYGLLEGIEIFSEASAGIFLFTYSKFLDKHFIPKSYIFIVLLTLGAIFIFKHPKNKKIV